MSHSSRRRWAIVLALTVASFALGQVTNAAAAPPDVPSKATAQAELDALTVASEGAMTGYSRDHFPHWTSVGRPRHAQHLRVSEHTPLVAPPGGVMTDEVGVITGELELRSTCAADGTTPATSSRCTRCSPRCSTAPSAERREGTPRAAPRCRRLLRHRGSKPRQRPNTLRPINVWNRSVWSRTPMTFVACGPIAATGTRAPVWLWPAGVLPVA